MANTTDFSRYSFNVAGGTERLELANAVYRYATPQYAYTPTYDLAIAGAGQTAAEAPAEPTYTRTTGTFGLLEQVEPVREAFLNVKRGLLDLREAFDQAPPERSSSLREELRDYLQAHASAAERRELFADFFREDSFHFPAWEAVVDPGGSRRIEVLDPDTGNSTLQTFFQENDHSALFHTGRAVTRDIRNVDALRYGLAVLRRRRQQALARRRAELAAVEAEIAEGRRELELRERRRSETLGDYAVAQRLVTEDWAATEQAFAERRRILEAHHGIYYVRVRETPLSAGLPDPLALRPSAAGDIVPGCPGAAAELPEELAPFMEAVLEIPMADWARLQPLDHLLPSRSRLQALVAARRQRLDRRLARPLQTGGSRLAARLAPLHGQTLQVSRELLARPFDAGDSLRAVQRQGSALLGLEDLLSGPAHRLRGPVQRLHADLNAAAGCLLERLRAIAPSIRLQWAGEAEADRLILDRPERWPGLERAEAGDFNGVRTLVELVQWWFGQLREGAGAAARTALRNQLRASLLFAAQDDPEQILQGRLSVVPGRLDPGAALRLRLNREPSPGTTLQLLDSAQRLVATLRVDDHDDQGTRATLTRVFDASVVPSTAFQVTGVIGPLRAP